jgi:hypothetical protein
LQIIGDALIQFDPYIIFEKIKALKFILIPLFLYIYLKEKIDLKRLKFVYLILIWYLVPWVVFTTYSGEMSDYYFAITRLISLMIISYLIFKAWSAKSYAVKGLVAVSLIAYCAYSFSRFLPYKDVGLVEREEDVFKAIEENRRIEFQVGVPESYLYYYHMLRKKGVVVY